VRRGTGSIKGTALCEGIMVDSISFTPLKYDCFHGDFVCNIFIANCSDLHEMMWHFFIAQLYLFNSDVGCEQVGHYQKSD
jgi:hypothetical protein